jgi:peptide/nickel transport system permease protein
MMFDWYTITRNRLAIAGAALVVVVLIAGLVSPLVAPFDPTLITPDALAPPTRAHLFGTDDLGRDIFSRVLYGARISPLVGLLAVAISASVGVTMGLIAGYAGGPADNVLMRVVDILLSFPGIVLAIGVVAILGPGLNHALVAVGIAGIPTFARVVRGSVLVEKEKEYVEAARLLGVPTPRLLLLHILPNVLAPVLVLSTLSVAGAILAAAGLSFIGLGAQLPTPEWGAMLSQGRNYLAVQWWVAAFPGAAIAMTVLGVNLMGDGIRDVLDPRLRV